jgi:hypothetical protein
MSKQAKMTDGDFDLGDKAVCGGLDTFHRRGAGHTWLSFASTAN